MSLAGFVALYGLPILAVVCLLLGARRGGRVSLKLLAVALIPPLAATALLAELWLIVEGGNLGAEGLFGWLTSSALLWWTLATCVVLALAMVATRRHWGASSNLTLIGLAMPMAMPIVPGYGVFWFFVVTYFFGA